MPLTANTFIQTNHLAGWTRHSNSSFRNQTHQTQHSMDDVVGSKAASAITTTNKKRPRRTSRNQTHQPQDSMDDAIGSKKAAEATVITTTNKKRPRRVRPTKSKPKEEEEALKEVDMEDLGFCGNEILEIRAFLLEWYDRNQRDLPWRRICSGDDEDGSDRRAYAVWVSEVMLQQTRVQTVIDYFNRWMHKWPTICHLARASIEEGSKKIVEGGGVFPKTVAALRKVPGIGDYTAGAIASIAFNEAVPVVDGNVIRVVARLKAIAANPKESVTIKNFWKLAGKLVDPSRPGDFNQALMELGATVCTPLNPNCSVCPVSNHCRALSLARQNKSAQVTDYPTKVVKSKKRHEFSAVSVVEILDGQDMIEELQPDGRFLLVKRPDEGLLAGLWEFPSVLLGVETDLATRRYAIDQFLKKSFNLDLKKSCTVVLREDIGEYIHVFSHIRLKMYVELLVLHLKGGKNVLHGKPESETKAWKSVDSKALSSMGLTSGVRKVFSMIQKFKQNKSEPIPGKTRKRKTPSS